MKGLNGKVSDLERAAAQRKAKLDENSAFLQFNWKADVVESWIGEHGLVRPQFLTCPGQDDCSRAPARLLPVQWVFFCREETNQTWAFEQTRHQGRPLEAARRSPCGLALTPRAGDAALGQHKGYQNRPWDDESSRECHNTNKMGPAAGTKLHLHRPLATGSRVPSTLGGGVTRLILGPT